MYQKCVQITQHINNTLAFRAYALLTTGLVVGLCGLGAVYLHVSNEVATLGFALQGIKVENRVLAEELESLNIKAAQTQTMFAMKSHPRIQGMARVSDKQYVIMKDGQVEMVTMTLPERFAAISSAY